MKRRNLSKTLTDMESYTRKWVPSVHEGKVICGYTFHPGLFRFWASKRFRQLLNIYGFKGIQKYARGVGVDYSLISNSLDLVLGRGLTSAGFQATATDFLNTARLMRILFPLESIEEFKGVDWRDEEIQSKLKAFVWEKDQSGEIPTKWYTSWSSWESAIGMVGRELTRVFNWFDDKEVQEEIISFYNGKVVEALVKRFEGSTSISIEMRNILHRIEEVSREAETQDKYAELANLLIDLQGSRYFKEVCKALDFRGVELPDEFVYAFVGTGLFALTRSLIAFEGKTFEGIGQEESLRMAREKMLGQTLEVMWDTYNKLK